MGGDETGERPPDAVHRAIGAAAAARAIGKPDFRAVQSRYGKKQWRENTIDVLNRAPADEGERATRGPGKPGKQCPQPVIRDNILGARHNVEKRAIGIEEISAGGNRRYPCEIARLYGDGGGSGHDPYQTPVLDMDAQGSRFGKGGPCCKSSIEILSGERMKAIAPSRGGRLMVTPGFMSLSHVA